MKTSRQKSSLAILLLLPSCLFAATGDIDNDGLRDAVETGTGIHVSPANTGTNPNLADTDGDSVPDGMEINQGTNPTNASSKITRPNIILINCDDLGYGDIGCFWQNQKTGTQKFSTPGLDAMAAEGVMLTHHYVGAPICASSRASLLQGRHQGHADVRDKDFDKALPNNHSIASLLKSSGYRTVHIGKAGLAGPGSVNLPAHPLLRGFDQFFGYYSHYTSQEHYPQNGTTSAKASLFNDYTKVTGAFVDLYTTDAFTGYAKKTIIEETQNNPNRPFFIYLAHTTPHFPNAVPPTPGYPAGFGLNGGVQWTGAPSYVNTATNEPSKINNIANQHPSVSPAWPKTAREHVSMIRRIDDSVSDILQTLRDLNIDQNTLVVFTADNGCDDWQIDPRFFQGYANFEGKKTDMWEGGIRIPTIAWAPGRIIGTNNTANIAKNTRPSGQWDWLATFADFAKIPAPSYTDGVSIAPSLRGSGTQRDKGYLYFEFFYSDLTRSWFPVHGNAIMQQMQNIRIGNFMGVRRNISSTSDNFMIYNMATDDKQQFNIAATRPDLQARMKYLAISARRPGGGVTRPYDTARIPAVTPNPVTNGLRYQNFEGYWPWIPEFRDLTAVSYGITANITPAVRSRSNDVGISFTGYVSVPTAGSYTFATASNAATSLWIHDGHVIDNDFNFTPNKSSAPVHLEAGLHPIRLYYRHQGGTPSLELSFSGPGFALQPVPASAFFVEGSPPTLLADEFTVKRNTPYLADLLANDTSERPLTLLSAGSNFLGATSVVSNQLFFEPVTDRLGVADFGYTATDGAWDASGQARATVLFDNERWIPFEEGSGTTVRSVGDNPQAVGIFSGFGDPAAAWRLGRHGKALAFDGIDDQVNFPGMTLPTGAAARTFSCWIRTNSRSSPEKQTIFSYGSNETGGLFRVRLDNVPEIDSNQPVMLDVLGGYVKGTKPINDGQWHHIAVVVADHDGGGALNVDEAKLFVDGQPDVVAESSEESMVTGSSLVPALGGCNHDGDCNFQGRIDDLRIFPRALGDAEIASLYAAAPWHLSPPAEPTNDTDGDGMSDVDEEVAGTDPEDPFKILRIVEMTPKDGSITLEWSAEVGRQYQVEESLDLTAWQPVTGVDPVSIAPAAQPATIVPPTLEVSFPHDSATRRFYRVRVTDAP